MLREAASHTLPFSVFHCILVHSPIFFLAETLFLFYPTPLGEEWMDVWMNVWMSVCMNIVWMNGLVYWGTHTATLQGLRHREGRFYIYAELSYRVCWHCLPSYLVLAAIVPCSWQTCVLVLTNDYTLVLRLWFEV